MKSATTLLLLTLGAVLAGCTVGPDYHPPATAMPAAYAEPPVAAAGPSDGNITGNAIAAPPVDLSRWWESFHDPELNSLIERAIAASPDLEIALDRVQEARAQEAVVLGMALPSGEFSGALGRGTGSDVTRGRVDSPLTASNNAKGLQQINKIAGFDAGWEIDLFGKYRRLIEAAHDDAQAAAEVRHAVLLTLAADVARGYVNLRALQQELEIARRNIALEQQTVDLVQARFDRGITNELDLAVAQRQLATVQAEVGPLTAEISAAQRRLAVLLGKFPDDLRAELQAPAPPPPPPAPIPPGAPIALLERRPDIRAAEWEFAAANARVGVAAANLFPRLSITGGLGWQGQGLGIAPVADSFIWSVGPSVYLPLFDLGTLDALIEVQDFRTREMFANYQRTVINAVEEADNAIASDAAQRERLRYLDAALAASQRAVDLSSQRYVRGLTDLLNVVDAERQLYTLQTQYASAQQDALVQTIALYKALGGGWENYQDIPPQRSPKPAGLAIFGQMADTVRQKLTRPAAGD